MLVQRESSRQSSFVSIPSHTNTHFTLDTGLGYAGAWVIGVLVAGSVKLARARASCGSLGSTIRHTSQFALMIRLLGVIDQLL